MLTPIKIAESVASAMGTSYQEAFTQRKRRNRPIADVRHITFHLVRKMTDASLVETGMLYLKHHTSVIYSNRLVKDLISTDVYFAEKVAWIEEHVKVKNTLQNA